MSYDKCFVEFHNGQKMPIIGIGTWTSKPEEIKLAIETAVEAGYKHIDTAFSYQNEKEIGSTLKPFFDSGKIKREDIFIVTKLPPNGMRASDVKHFLELSLKNLQLDYVDLYLVHTCIGFQNVGDNDVFPRGPDGNHLLDITTDLVAIWKEMEKMVELGLTKSIGVSNWSISQLQRILDICKIKPANIQVECHVYFQQDDLVDYCHQNGITVCAYAPIGSPGMPAFMERARGVKLTQEIPHLLSDPVIGEIAKKHQKQPNHVLLRFLMQRGIVVIPKSINPERIISNLDVSNFKLDSADMDTIRKQDKKYRMFSMNFVNNIEKHPEFNGYQ